MPVLLFLQTIFLITSNCEGLIAFPQLCKSDTLKPCFLAILPILFIPSMLKTLPIERFSFKPSSASNTVSPTHPKKPVLKNELRAPSIETSSSILNLPPSNTKISFLISSFFTTSLGSPISTTIAPDLSQSDSITEPEEVAANIISAFCTPSLIWSVKLIFSWIIESSSCKKFFITKLSLRPTSVNFAPFWARIFVMAKDMLPGKPTIVVFKSCIFKSSLCKAYSKASMDV